MYVNEIVIVGNLTADPQEVNLSNGTAANMRIAVDKRSTTPEGKEVERTEYVDVEAYGVQAENCIVSLSKGDRCIIVGELRYDEWQDTDGNNRSKHKIKAKVVGSSLEFAKAEET